MEIAAPRYCPVPFPAYRFVPGRHPHPTAHPSGHSFLPPGASHPAVVYRTPAQWRDSIDYLYGCDLYNHGYWWEAHEAWEGLWQLADKKGPQGHFLQLVIQVSACHLKLHTGKIAGVGSLRQSSRGHLAAFVEQAGSAVFMGLAVQPWYAGVDAYYDRILDDRRHSVPAHEPRCYPYIRLVVA